MIVIGVAFIFIITVVGIAELNEHDIIGFLKSQTSAEDVYAFGKFLRVKDIEKFVQVCDRYRDQSFVAMAGYNLLEFSYIVADATLPRDASNREIERNHRRVKKKLVEALRDTDDDKHLCRYIKFMFDIIHGYESFIVDEAQEDAQFWYIADMYERCPYEISVYWNELYKLYNKRNSGAPRYHGWEFHIDPSLIK